MSYNRAEYMKEYRAKNKEKTKLYQKAWEEAHKEERRPKKKIADDKYKASHKEERKVYNRTPKRRYGTAKTDAARRGLEFALSFEYWWAEVQKLCFFCQDRLGQRSVTTVGLDRLNNTLGYIEGNVKSCCIKCNKLKLNEFSVEETQAMVELVVKMRETKKE